MTTHTSAHALANNLHHSLSDAASRADRRLVEAAQASDRVHRQITRALDKDGPEALFERRRVGRMEPLVGQLSSRAQQLARQGLHMASNAGHKAQQSWGRYAEATTGYVARQPMRSVLIAAAVGAGVALLIASSRKRY